MTCLGLDRTDIVGLKTRFLAGQPIPEGLLPDPIRRSWQRCLAKKIDTDRQPNEFTVVSRTAVNTFRERSKNLFSYAEPVISELQGQISSTNSAVILSDANGIILHVSGDPVFLKKTRKLNLHPGGIWSEEVIGTNAIGTALVERCPVSVNCSEHFVNANHQISCSAAPIFDAQENIAGVLNVSSGCEINHRHTLALVCMSAQIIKKQIFSSMCNNSILLHFHMRTEFIGTLYEGLVAISPDGKLLALNRFARAMLGMGNKTLADCSLQDIVDRIPQEFTSTWHTLPSKIFKFYLKNGAALFGRFQLGVEAIINPSTTNDDQQNNSACLMSTNIINNLADLSLGDPALNAAITKTKKILNHDIPLIIQGESGSGKEMFAQAFHRDSKRKDKAFIALNCAAIPENLIESELFGYCDGAFTGARKAGYVGKIQQADGGTLFLDEIGDMPLCLQARLLRVLQERSVTPLGGAKSIPVDIKIICATNKQLYEEVLAGRFREDLYYRLNGMAIKLPPLRQRKDILNLAHKILKQISHQSDIEFSPQVTELFMRHPWPGNIRQLHNVIRTGCALCDDHAQITVEHLTDDFLHQAGESVQIADENSTQRLCLKTQENALIQQILREKNGNISATANKLGISRSTLYRKIKDID